MSPPIRDGSGNSIGSIRLGDGSEISEVRTGAGDVLFSATTIPDASDLQNPDIYYTVTEGSGTSLSDEQGAIDGTVNGATWESGEGVGDAYLSLDGTDDDARMNSAPTPSLQDSRAFAAWVQPDTTSSPRGCLSHGNTRSNNDLLHYRFRSGNIQFGDFTSGGTVTGLSFSAGTWHLCVATFDSSSGTGFGYIAAVGDSSPSSISTPMSFNNTTGQMFWGSELGSSFFLRGDIDLLLFYNRHLSSTEVSNLFNNTKSLYQ